LPVHSKCINNVLRRNVSHDHTSGVYQDDTDSSFKIGMSSFKFNNKHVFIDGKNYKATQGLWELLSPNLIETWSACKTNKHINKYYSNLML